MPAFLERRVDLLACLTPEAAAAYSAVTNRRLVATGDVVYRQLDVRRYMYRIQSGRVWLSYSWPDGRELLFHLATPGEILGISTLVDHGGLPHTATARTDVVLQVLERHAFDQLRRRHPSFNEAILQSLCRDIRLLSSHLSEAAFDELPPRIARRLVNIARRQPDGTVKVFLSQAEMAAMFGVSRQSVNKVLRGFEGEGLVRLSYGEVELLDVAALLLRCDYP